MGCENSADDWTLNPKSARVAASKPLCSGRGKTIGAVTASKTLDLLCRLHLRHLLPVGLLHGPRHPQLG